MRHLIPAIVAAAAVAAAPAATAREKLEPEAELAKLLEGRVAGEPQKCIPLSTARSSQTIDKTATVYKVGSPLSVNRPEGGAESLDDDAIPVLPTSGRPMCSTDT